jgi:Fic family protein
MMDKLEFLARFIYESELIEGIATDLKQIEKEVAEQKDTGHVGALLYAEKRAGEKEKFLTEDDIKLIQKLIIEEHLKKNPFYQRFLKDIGEYRKVNVSIGGRMGALPETIPKKMEKLVVAMNQCQRNFFLKRKELNLDVIAEFHYEFEMIHPFVDGNGRTGRILVFYLLLYFNKKPFIFYNSEKTEYFISFKISDPECLKEYFIKKINELNEK